MELYTFIIEAGEEMMQVLEHEFAEMDLREDMIVSAIGAVDECCISNMLEDDARDDILSEYRQPF